MNIFLLLYADDTVLMAETPEDLQKTINFPQLLLGLEIKSKYRHMRFFTGNPCCLLLITDNTDKLHPLSILA
jgi:hypothetical protein